MSDLTKFTLSEAKEGLIKKSFSACELTQAYLRQTEKGRDLNAYVLETPEIALEQAKACDDRLARGEQARLMEGIPLASRICFVLRVFVLPRVQKSWKIISLPMNQLSQKN